MSNPSGSTSDSPSTRRSKEIADFFHLSFVLFGPKDCPEADAFRTWAGKSKTLSEVWESCHRSDWLLKMLAWAVGSGLIPNADDRCLRLFACWCAKGGLQPREDEARDKVLKAAEDYALGRASREEMQKAQADTVGGAWGAAVIGMPRRIASAAGQLARWHTANECTLQAAFWSAWFAVKAASFAAGEEGWIGPFVVHGRSLTTCCFELESPQSPVAEEVASAVRRQQANQLRKFVGNPFQQVDPVRLARIRLGLNSSN